MRTALRVALGVAVLAAAGQTAARAEPAAPPCQGPLQRKEVADLLFGRDIGHRTGVSEAAWSRFVAREITPRFPDGLTIINAVGQWRDRATGTIVREPAKQVEIVLPGGDDDEARLAAIAAAYKRAFRQHAVGVIVRSACVSF